MNSRERILKCIRHEPIDRVPVNTCELVGWNENAWENRQPSYKKLMDAVREYTDCIYWRDPVYIHKPDPKLEEQQWQEGDSTYKRFIYKTAYGDLTKTQRKEANINTTWNIEHLLKDIADIKKYLSIPYEVPEVDMSAFYREQEQLGDKGVMILSVPDPIHDAAMLFGMDLFLEYAVTEKEQMVYLMDALHERQMCRLRKLLKHDLADVIVRVVGPEFATPPYLSPAYFDLYVTGYLKEICKELKWAGAIVRIHSHGKVGKVMDRFAGTEADIIEPVEPPPDGDIALKELKRLYGKRFCLMGNMELKELEMESPQYIDRRVREIMEDAREGGGFMLMPTAAPINVPLSKKTEENYLQMFESALKYGVY